ncbi:hypothetical protein TNCV_137741 [Trichonephila clavipes]|nr:hypothetical protein TNCV_137741 [Trichonephila clavipes]
MYYCKRDPEPPADPQIEALRTPSQGTGGRKRAVNWSSNLGLTAGYLTPGFKALGQEQPRSLQVAGPQFEHFAGALADLEHSEVRWPLEHSSTSVLYRSTESDENTPDSDNTLRRHGGFIEACQPQL